MALTARPVPLDEQAAILNRHAVRRCAGVPTVTLLVGPPDAGLAVWRRWAAALGLSVVVEQRDRFPLAAWLRQVAEQIDLPAAALQEMARRVNRDPDEFRAAWRTKTPADREGWWSSCTPDPDDEPWRRLAELAATDVSWATVAAALEELGERHVPALVRLAPATRWPSVLFVCQQNAALASLGPVVASWALRLSAIPLAIAVSAREWAAYLAGAPESRTRALLKEGELAVTEFDANQGERRLLEAGLSATTAALVAERANTALVEAALGLLAVTTARPLTPELSDRARSAAERFLYEFLESLAETAGRFELNGQLAFSFGPRRMEVDLLCREPRIAIEIDGYFHFLDASRYRRDRSKDWELQRRDYRVLRFLAEDVIPQLELIRDRILAALHCPSEGEST